MDTIDNNESFDIIGGQIGSVLHIQIINYVLYRFLLTTISSALKIGGHGALPRFPHKN
jgi:hypothetical protein